MRIVRLFHDTQRDTSALELVDVPCDTAVTTEIAHSAQIPAVATFFREVTGAGEKGWHTAPFPQFIAVLKGGLKVEVSSGASYTFQPGEVLLVEDVSGPGHRSWTFSGRFLHIQIPFGTDVLSTTSGTSRPLEI